MERTYVYHNLTTGQHTSDPEKAFVWWKRGDWLRCYEETAQ